MVSLGAVWEINTAEWDVFADRLNVLRAELPSVQEGVLREIGDRLRSYLQGEVIGGNHIWTGTYLQSLDYFIDEGTGTPQLVFGLFPQGEQADRLNIYFRGLEPGAQPNLMMGGGAPKKALVAWSIAKFGSPEIGLAVAAKNRKGQGGINANPILSTLFVLDGEQNPISLTQDAELIIAEALGGLMEDVEFIMYKTGKQVRRRDPVTGRFVKL